MCGHGSHMYNIILYISLHCLRGTCHIQHNVIQPRPAHLLHYFTTSACGREQPHNFCTMCWSSSSCTRVHERRATVVRHTAQLSQVHRGACLQQCTDNPALFCLPGQPVLRVVGVWWWWWWWVSLSPPRIWRAQYLAFF